MERDRRERGLTLVEIIVAAVIGSVIAGGTMMAFVTAVQLSQRATEGTVAVAMAEQTLERFRNHIACDDAWFDADCIGVRQDGIYAGNAELEIPVGSELLGFPPVSRSYTFEGVDADADGEPDYYRMQVRVCWDDPDCEGGQT